MANPNPRTDQLDPWKWKKGQSANPGGLPRKPRPDIEALNRLIADLEAEPGISKTWLREALGDPKTGKPPDFAFFKLLIEYRNGKVKEEKTVEDLDDEPASDDGGNTIDP